MRRKLNTTKKHYMASKHFQKFNESTIKESIDPKVEVKMAVNRLDGIGGDLDDILGKMNYLETPETDKFAKKIHTIIDNIDNLMLEMTEFVDSKEKSKKMKEEDYYFESDNGSDWFDERGDMLKTLPGDCILACSGQGRVDDDVSFWVEELDFTNGLPRERAIKYLREYGAWDDEELNKMTAKSLAEKILWIFCNDLKELAYEMMDDETSLVADWGNPSTWGDDEWERFQKEYSYCSLNA